MYNFYNFQEAFYGIFIANQWENKKINGYRISMESKLWTKSKIPKIKILHKIGSKDLMIVALDLLKVYIQNMLGIMFSYKKWF